MADHGTEKQPTDSSNSEAIASSNRIEASGEHIDAVLPGEMPTATDIMSAINQLSQNVDKSFDTLQISLADLKQTMADVEERLTSNKSGLNEHESQIKALEDRCTSHALTFDPPLVPLVLLLCCCFSPVHTMKKVFKTVDSRW
ncbi:hypothetical protein JOB18_040335 [Solea senegalensis]|uniref:Uncharacterized protein n=1 Tax=Solea senegalensis TaxID=28829 RepID=A0AAV6RQ58_SOLSE|nr:hypothetical protein JOB18_040335 [Solea senegalensis]